MRPRRQNKVNRRAGSPNGSRPCAHRSTPASGRGKGRRLGPSVPDTAEQGLGPRGEKSTPDCNCELDARSLQRGPNRQVLVGLDKLVIVAGNIISYTGAG
ncbi:uncharacterized protein LOC111090282 isoform X2 [Canis lupus familiaris]|uniref:uncharacterized protein LOC111090282 isoform X2 n=1 Tax=Canis lupus familiaris TaxID=9615 RepID=UPI0018F51A62|nr:uncharacterized protein LOC111090282 isoform X2 [Canis lupus familiaris]XP_038545711.1 uncharacterized protein LOC111090282 isoform X2 [Canis lupus familiaris]